MTTNEPLQSQNMVLERHQLLSFDWQKDATGYDLSSDRRLIVRRMGRMVRYDPLDIDPPLHHTFANLFAQLWQVDESRDGAGGPNAPFHERRFDDLEDALLAFVNEYGILGSPERGANAKAEPVEYLQHEQEKLMLFFYFGMNEPDTTPDKLFDPYAPPMRLRLRKGYAGRYQIKIEPETLQGWMWLRIAEELQTGVDWYGPRCLYCGAPMARGPGARRSDARFCKSKCRTYFHRLSATKQRQRTAAARRARKEPRS